jgi:hypothetical protein
MINVNSSLKEISIKNTRRSNTFGLVINPKLENKEIDWVNLLPVEMELKLKELVFPSKFDVIEILNSIEFDNIRGNSTEIEDFDGQFELGNKTKIPHYQIAIKTKTLCLKKGLLEVLTNSLNAFINIEIQFNYSEMRKYCLKESKESDFFLEEYSGKITKHQWKLDFADRKGDLKTVFGSPYAWQKFFLEEILIGKPESRVVDWLVDPVGNSGKSSFARAYVSQKGTDAILMKIDNLDRMELALIQKISNYREKYYKDPRIIFFDFPRATDFKKVVAATALMEDAKSGYLETCFGGKHREIQIGNVHVVVMSNTAPDLSVLSEDRWRLWQLGGSVYENVIWPCKCYSEIVLDDEAKRMLEWKVKIRSLSVSELEEKVQFKGLKLDKSWLLIAPNNGPGLLFGACDQSTKSVACPYYEAPNEIKLKLLHAGKGKRKNNI